MEDNFLRETAALSLHSHIHTDSSINLCDFWSEDRGLKVKNLYKNKIDGGRKFFKNTKWIGRSRNRCEPNGVSFFLMFFWWKCRQRPTLAGQTEKLPGSRGTTRTKSIAVAVLFLNRELFHFLFLPGNGKGKVLLSERKARISSHDVCIVMLAVWCRRKENNYWTYMRGKFPPHSLDFAEPWGRDLLMLFGWLGKCCTTGMYPDNNWTWYEFAVTL